MPFFKPHLTQTNQTLRVLAILILTTLYFLYLTQRLNFLETPSQTPFSLSRKKCVLVFESPFSVSSEEDDHLLKTSEKEDRLLKDPLDSDLNVLFQIEEVVGFEKLVLIQFPLKLSIVKFQSI